MNPWKLLPLVALAGCGVATVEISDVSEEETAAKVEHSLSSRLRAAFGETARVNHVVEDQKKILVGVALEGAPIDGDDLPPVAFALYEPKTDAFAVINAEAKFTEARLWGVQPALVSMDGELLVADKVLTTGVKGDLSVSADRTKVALTLGHGDDGESAIALVDLDGNVTPIADSEGVDDRPTLSPDNKTLVFVSGRSGTAAFYRTSTAGEPPVQITNTDLTLIEATDDEEFEPAGFVPPPVHAERVWWVDADTLRYDAGGGEFWKLNVRTGAAAREVK